MAPSDLRIATPNPKRSRRPGGAEAWYPYYAGYGELFVDAALDALKLEPEACVLDPWNGSGTTTRVAQRRGLRAIGVDINPIATIVASAKTASCADASHLGGLAEEVVAAARDAELAKSDPLLGWLSPRPAAFVRAAHGRILHLLATRPDGSVVDPLAEPLPPLASFLTVCLLRAVRDSANPVTGSNPTWQREESRRVTTKALADTFLERVTAFAQDFGATEGHKPPSIILGDARDLSWCADASVDAVVTSPPYCTRLDYVVSTSMELAVLGLARHSTSFQALRLRTTGTPLTRQREIPDPSSAWGPMVTQVLGEIRDHASPDSRSYYYKSYWQYFSDLYAALNELRRVLREGGRAIFVLQNSYYKGVEIDLPQLVMNMAQVLGFDAGVASSHPVRQVLTTMNSRSQKHRDAMSYREEVVALRNGGESHAR